MMMSKSWAKSYYKKDIKEEQGFIKATDKEISELKKARKSEKHWLNRFLIGDALRKARTMAYDRKKLRSLG